MTPQFLVQASGWTVMPLAKVGSQEEEQLGGGAELSWVAAEFEGAGRQASRPESGAERRGESCNSSTGVRQGDYSTRGVGRVRGACAGDFERE